MTLVAILANLQCSDLRQSGAWFTDLFGRQADAAPMDGLLEWHHGEGAGLQLVEQPATAGAGTLTLIVTDLPGARRRLAHLAPGPIEAGDAVHLLRLKDPDGNLVVLVEPH